jgi:DNA-binding response OmpR family regulator
MGAPRRKETNRPDGGEGRPSSPGRKSLKEKAPAVMVLMAYRPVGSLLETSLKDEGMEALQCHSAGEALSRLGQGKASVVITDPADLFWQDPQALELLERLTETPVVAFSALSTQELYELPLKFAAIVAKSSNLEPLVETLRSLRGG